MMEEELKKFFITMPDHYGKFCAIIQVSGFETEEQAHQYLFELHQVNADDILREGITIH